MGHRPSSLAKGIMIIDCHGHYTTEPKDLHRFRKDQTEAVKTKGPPPPRAGLKMSDDEIRASIEGADHVIQTRQIGHFLKSPVGFGHPNRSPFGFDNGAPGRSILPAYTLNHRRNP